MNTLVQLRSGELKGATRLTLSEGLTHFPDEIFSLSESLEILDLSGNRLTDLPNDLSRLAKLKVIFASFNHFKHVPNCLAACTALEMIGFKGNHIELLPEDALPVNTRWLILTDNCLEALPSSIGELRCLQKLMLAGNKLTSLPNSIVQCSALQLVRVSANRLTEFPDVLLQLPSLAWLAFAGNPFCEDALGVNNSLPEVLMDDVSLMQELGDGASGVIWRAHWLNNQYKLPADIAVKVFKGSLTSDGFVKDELMATLAAGHHENLVSPLAYVAGKALLLALIPCGYINLGGPPSLNSCTRDTFADGAAFAIVDILTMVDQLESVVDHIHGRGLCHGDIYAHNVLLGPEKHILLTDFGAASPCTGLAPIQQKAVQKIELRAQGFFILDLLTVCRDEDKHDELYQELISKATQLLL